MCKAFNCRILYGRYTANIRTYYWYFITSHSFIPGLKPSFLQILPIVAFLFFFRTGYLDFTDCLLLLLSISVFYFSVFLFSLFSCWFRALDQADSCRLLSARENSISYRIVSYRIDIPFGTDLCGFKEPCNIRWGLRSTTDKNDFVEDSTGIKSG